MLFRLAYYSTGRSSGRFFFESTILDVLSQGKLCKGAVSRLPATHHWPEGTKDGAFVAYGPSQLKVFRQLANPLARFLHGEDPGILVRRAELVINLKVAGQLGITVSPSFQLRADEVIE